MSSIENALVNLLLNDAGVSALVGARIDPFPLPQSPGLPALTYMKDSGARFHSLCGSSGLAKPHIQIDCWADKESEVQNLAEAVRLALQGFRGTVLTYDIQAILLVDEFDGYEGEDKLRRTTLIFEVWHQEEIPTFP